MQVREIMTASPITCTPETSLGVAAGRMAEFNVGILPVVTEKGVLAGVVTDRDICLAVSRTNRNALNIAVREVMTRKVLSAHDTDDVRAALAAMRTARVRRVPVLDEAGRIAGLLSVDDVVVRGVPRGDIAPRDVVETLHEMYVRRRVA